MTINGNEYSWGDVNIVVLGRLVTGIRGIDYKTSRKTESLYAAGEEPRANQRGPKSYAGTLTLLQSEVIALNQAAVAKGYDDITDVDFDAVVSYIPRKSTMITTDKITGIAITEIPQALKQGDLQQEIALPFIAQKIDYNS